jgi:lipoprotein-anchoring transpeptidase ErfK/SrfK
MRRLLLAAALLVGLAAPVSAGVVVRIDNSAQRMHVYVDGGLAYVWPVSTARRGYWTPPGNYSVQRMARMWYSRKYHMSPMPYSLFFYGGYAIHGTGASDNSSGGQRAMAVCACIRLTRARSIALWDLTAAPAYS